MKSRRTPARPPRGLYFENDYRPLESLADFGSQSGERTV